MNELVATIDLGTNTFHLLIAKLDAENSFQMVHRERIPVMIGRGGINLGIINKEAQQRALNALSHFKERLDSFGVSKEKVHCTATSAIRNAKNGQGLIDSILQQTGIQVDVISGDKEAEYIYYGVRHAVPLGAASALIMDIGGGSVEFIICNQEQIHWKQSFEIGAQRLLDRFEIQDPITDTNIESLNNFFEQTLSPLSENIAEYKPETLIGASGTFDTLSEIHVLESNLQVDQEATELPLSHEAFQRMLTQFSMKNREERLLIPGMIEMRVDMIVVASWLINYVLENYGLREIRISSYALKEGLLVQIAREIL